MAANDHQRLAYIDWMRGLACVLMFQTHCYDSWLGGPARSSSFFGWSQLGGTLPAPLFLFLAGISFALVTDKLRRKDVPPGEIARTTMRRGGEIFLYGFLFRLQEFLLGQPWAPWTDLLRVDVLNIIGLSMILMGLACRLASRRVTNGLLAAAIAPGIALVTPPLWTTWRPRWLPWYLESYVNGVHTFSAPQPWLFPLFPWAGFAFAGLAVGFVLCGDRARKNPGQVVAWLGAGGVALFCLGRWTDALPQRLYAVYDFWHSSPEFFFERNGVVLVILLLSYAWCRWGFGQKGFSPLLLIGQTSLVVYWVHIEFVYGRFSILAKRAQTIRTATLGLGIIFAAMLLLSVVRAKMKERNMDWQWFRRLARC